MKIFISSLITGMRVTFGRAPALMFWLAPCPRGIWSSSSPVRRIARRHLTRGQRAMALAFIHPGWPERLRHLVQVNRLPMV